MQFPNWIIGVILACMASFVSNLGLNLQKLNHLRNDRAAAASSSSSLSSTSATSHAVAARSPSPPPNTHIHSHDASVEKSFSRQAGAPTPLQSVTRTYPSYHSTEDLSTHSMPSPTATNASFASPAASSSPAPLSRTPSPPPSPLHYHRQTLWRVGLFLVILGSLADFVALIFAAQSIIAPLGSLTLVFNTMLAPLLLGEHTGSVDVLATVAIVLGSSLSVACADHRDRMYGLDELFGLFLKPRFVCYSLLVVAIIAGLYYHIRYLTSTSTSASPSNRKHTRFCYASLAGIVGAQSVLFAKCVGTMVVDMLTGHSVLFVHVEAWVILALLSLTITFQIHYLNEGLRLFASSYVIPIYQSFWILGSVTAGMIFFGEYKGVMDQWGTAIGFPVGVIVVVAGVCVLSQRGGADEDDGGLEGDEDGGEVAEDEEMSVAGSEDGEKEREQKRRKEQAKREDDDRRRALVASRLVRVAAQLPYQPLISASQSHHIAFPSVSSSSFFLQVPYPPRSLRRAVVNGRSRTELQTAPIVSSPVLYMQLSSSSPEASYVPDMKQADERRSWIRPAGGESRVREQLYD